MKFTQLLTEATQINPVPDEAEAAISQPVTPAVAPETAPELSSPEGTPDVPAVKSTDAAYAEIAKIAQGHKIALYGRKPTGAYFAIPGLDQLNDNVKHAFDKQLADDGEQTMEQQYEELRSNVDLIVSGKSNFGKALLVTGAPSSGKTYNVMQTIKALGLSEGKDYIIKKGRVTDTAVWRTLIEQVNGMVIFDDCDSVMETKNGANIMKGALDTDPVREISSDAGGMLNLAVLPMHEREDYIGALSNVLRYTDTEDDVLVIETTFHRMKLLGKILRDFEKDRRREGWQNEKKGRAGSVENDDYASSGGSREEVILEYARNHLPNKFDFKGRIIFISNMNKEEWNSAVLTRVLYQDMNFRSDEMLDFIDRIYKTFDTPGLTDEQKLEVLQYIRQRYEAGKLKSPVNFRLVQMAWDLRLVPRWQQKINRW